MELLIIASLYFLPMIVAFIRQVPNQGSIAVINVLLGWTVIGWVIALAMAARTVPTRPSSLEDAERRSLER